MTQFFTRLWWWCLGCLAFFTIFAFALNNRAVVTVHWFFGYESRIQLVLLVLLVLMLGVFLGAIAVLPLWWRQYHQQQQRQQLFSQNLAQQTDAALGGAAAGKPQQPNGHAQVEGNLSASASLARPAHPLATDEVIDAV